MSRIQQLSRHVVNKIAAGEVIERPASVVKELLENSVDALATRIEVDVVDGGAELIRVVDDGEGIHPDDILLAVTSHATSKIQAADDLFHVQTMGFRGEALASIAEVSQFRIRSRPPTQAEGIELEVSAGAWGDPCVCGCPIGTQIELRQLFCNTPVRRKFLKTASTELGHICEQFMRIALANPRLHMVLRHNHKMVYELPATDQLIERLKLFYGDELTEQLIWVESELHGVRIWGYVAHPSQSKSTRKGQYLFLNGRWIQDRTLQHALAEAYRGLLMVGRYGIMFLFLEMPPDLIDVNVHPTKAEVRFQDSQSLYRQLLSTIRTKFLSMDLDSKLKVPEGQGAIAGVQGSLPHPAARGAVMLQPPDPARQAQMQDELAEWAKIQLAQWTPSAPIESHADSGRFETLPDWSVGSADAAGARVATEAPDEFLAPASLGEESVDRSAHDGGAWDSGNRERIDEPVAFRSAAPLGAGVPRAMQIHDAYLVAETDEGLTVIDQHALHERVLYEQFRARVLAGAVESQRLLMPETIELTPSEAALLLEHVETLARLGFDLADFGGNTVILSSYPVMLRRANLPILIREIAEKLGGSDQAPTRRDLLDELLHMMSCKAAIKAGQRLTPEEIESLLTQRHLIDDAHHCPHGRPTALVLSRSELDRQFGRMG